VVEQMLMQVVVQVVEIRSLFGFGGWVLMGLFFVVVVGVGPYLGRPYGLGRRVAGDAAIGPPSTRSR